MGREKNLSKMWSDKHTWSCSYDVYIHNSLQSILLVSSMEIFEITSLDKMSDSVQIQIPLLRLIFRKENLKYSIMRLQL